MRKFVGDYIEDYAPLMKEVLRHETNQAMDLGKILIEEFNPRSVIDIGCGPGIYLVPFKSAGIKVFGIDGCEVGGECLSEEEFERVDLRFPWYKDKFDLALCIEVAGHINPDYLDILVDTVTNSSDKIFWCAEHEGQVGHHHFDKSCKSKQEWSDIFNSRGYVNYSREQHILDRICREVRGMTDWFPVNSQIFVKG